MEMESALFWDFTQRRMLIPHRRFGTNIGPIFKSQAVQDEGLILEDETDRLSGNVGS